MTLLKKGLPVIMLGTMIALSLSSFKNYTLNEELWTKLGIGEEKVENSIKNSFLNGYLEYWSARNIKNIVTGNRAAVAKDLCAYAKTYVSTPEFNNTYKQHRDGLKPQAPKAARSEQQLRDEYLKSLREGVKNSEDAKSKMSAEYEKSFDESIASLKEQIKEAEKPGSEMINYMVMGEKINYDNQMKTYEEKMEEWNAEYPESPDAFVKRRLQQVLELTKDVDYNAALKESYNKKVFVNPVYEHKSKEWKQAFRAGKEATDATRMFVVSWLKQVN